MPDSPGFGAGEQSQPSAPASFNEAEHQANFAFGPPPNTVETARKENNPQVRNFLFWVAIGAVFLAARHSS